MVNSTCNICDILTTQFYVLMSILKFYSLSFGFLFFFTKAKNNEINDGDVALDSCGKNKNVFRGFD